MSVQGQHMPLGKAEPPATQAPSSMEEESAMGGTVDQLIPSKSSVIVFECIYNLKIIQTKFWKKNGITGHPNLGILRSCWSFKVYLTIIIS